MESARMTPLIETQTLTEMAETCERMSQNPNLNRAKGGYKCDFCRDLGWELTEKGAKPCQHLAADKTAKLLAQLPPKYHQFRLEELQPLPTGHPNWHEKHAQLIALMNYNPYLSYLILGTWGKGKTTFAYCLYRRALEEGRPALAITLAELLKQMRSFDTPCVVNLEEVRRNQERQFLLIDEFGDAGGRVTEFASASLRELINVCEESNTQLVITANKDEAELERYWSQADPERGPAIMRKLKQKKGAKIVEMF